jgi:hypothetical protein
VNSEGDLFDNHHTWVGFVVDGYASTFPPAMGQFKTEKVAVNFVFNDWFSVSNVWPTGTAGYGTNAPRFAFRAIDRSFFRRMVGGDIAFSFELRSKNIGDVEYVIGKAVEDFDKLGAVYQSIVTLSAQGEFGDRGLKLKFQGDLGKQSGRWAGMTHPTLAREQYEIELSIEWRVLRFLLDDILLTKELHEKCVKAQKRDESL